MNLKRAIGFSVLAYVATFIIGIIAAVSIGLDSAEVEDIPTSMWIVGLISAVVLVKLAAWLYFRSPSVPASGRNGFLFGIIAVITGFVLDIATVLPTGSLNTLWDYYANMYFWITVVAIIIVTTLLGARLGVKKASGNSPQQPPTQLSQV